MFGDLDLEGDSGGLRRLFLTAGVHGEDGDLVAILKLLEFDYIVGPLLPSSAPVLGAFDFDPRGSSSSVFV